jgi:hypothetical protein
MWLPAPQPRTGPPTTASGSVCSTACNATAPARCGSIRDAAILRRDPAGNSARACGVPYDDRRLAQVDHASRSRCKLVIFASLFTAASRTRHRHVRQHRHRFVPKSLAPQRTRRGDGHRLPQFPPGQQLGVDPRSLGQHRLHLHSVTHPSVFACGFVALPPRWQTGFAIKMANRTAQSCRTYIHCRLPLSVTYCHPRWRTMANTPPSGLDLCGGFGHGLGVRDAAAACVPPVNGYGISPKPIVEAVKLMT